MEKIFIKSLAIAAISGITVRALKAIRLYKKQVEAHEEILEDSNND